MAKLWQGELHGALNQAADDFNSSIKVDGRIYAQDIKGSIAHATMLGACGIIEQQEAETLVQGLQSILDELNSGELHIDLSCEDIHSFVEQELCRRLGAVGKKLHTARSRNDQVALDLRLYLRDECEEVISELQALLAVICTKAERCGDMLMPGYTHLQRAQPVTFAHHLCAYGMAFCRDIERLRESAARMNRSPLGAAALAGTGFPIDRQLTASLLGCSEPMPNSLDAVADRDFCVETAAALSLIMTHLSRFSEEIILWCSSEFAFVRLSDAFTTGSSIMPQKKNPDIAELARGKTGRVYGNLITLLTLLKGLPLAYNKDLQEDKEAIFDSVDTVKACLNVFAPMLEELQPQPETMLAAAKSGFLNATDLADYITELGIPFRDAYRISSNIVNYCINNKKDLEQLDLEEYRQFCPEIGAAVYEAVDIRSCLSRRKSLGGAAPNQLKAQLDYLRGYVK